MTRRPVAVLVGLLLLVAACDEPVLAPSGGDVLVDVWFHEAEGPARDLLDDQVRRFNERQDAVTARVRVLPGAGYADQVLEAAGTDEFPDLVHVPASIFPTLVAGGHLADLNPRLRRAAREDLSPWVLADGNVGGSLFGIASGVSVDVIVADVEQVAASGARVPRTAGTAWTATEFVDVMDALHDGGVAVDLGFDGPPERIALRLAALARSAGEGVVNPLATRASGFLDSPETTRVFVSVRDWAAAVGAPDHGGTSTSPVPGLRWGPIESAGLAAANDRVVVVPPPDLGVGIRSARSAHRWAVAAGVDDAVLLGCLRLVEFLLQPAEQDRLVDATGLLSATSAGLSADPRVATGGVARLVLDQLRSGATVGVPPTAAWRDVAVTLDALLESVANDGRAVFPLLHDAAADVDRMLSSAPPVRRPGS